MRLLLIRDGINLDKPDNHGRTLLCQASLNGHEAVVRLLRQARRLWSDTWVVGFGGWENEVVAQPLTLDDVVPEKPDNASRTPLLIANMYGHWENMAIL